MFSIWIQIRIPDNCCIRLELTYQTQLQNLSFEKFINQNFYYIVFQKTVHFDSELSVTQLIICSKIIFSWNYC